MPARGKYLQKGKVSKEMAKAESLSGVRHVTNIGSQAVAHKDIIVPSIIQGDSRQMCNLWLYSSLYFSMHTSSEAES